MAKLSTKGLMLLALVLSLVTTLLIYKYLSGISEQANKPGVPVIVAKVDIPPRTKITDEMVQEINVPPEYIQPGAMTELAKVVGVTTREQIIASEQITQRRLVVEGKPIGFSGLIPHDKRAITVAVTEVTGVAGFVKPGDYVDVVVTFDKSDVGSHTSKVVLQSVLVLAVDHDTEAGTIEDKAKDKDNRDSSTRNSTVTLAVTDNDAAQITLAEEKGKFKLALRPYMPIEVNVAATASTPQDQVGFQASPVSPNNENASSGKSSGADLSGGSSGGTVPSSAPVKAQSSAGVQTIRGTKVETVPVN